MDIEKLIEQLKDLEACAFGYQINGEVLGMDCSDFEQVMVDAADALKKLRAELEQVKRDRDAAVDCIYKIEDALDRGNDNDWAREHISEWESQKEG